MTALDDFIEQRREGNRAVLGREHLGIKRFYNLDEAAYRDGALPGRTKELAAWRRRWCCAATTALITTSCSA
jgi:hypothetical protein